MSSFFEGSNFGPQLNTVEIKNPGGSGFWMVKSRKGLMVQFSNAIQKPDKKTSTFWMIPNFECPVFGSLLYIQILSANWRSYCPKCWVNRDSNWPIAWSVDSLLPKCKALGQGRPLLEPGTVWDAGSTDLHDFQERFGNVRQGIEGKALPIRGRHAVAPIGAPEALALSARCRAEGRCGCWLDFGNAE